MTQVEHLDLITSVHDDFTADLMRLSSLLETAGQLGDRLSPIRIRTEVYDRDLDQLLAKMTALEAMDTRQTFNVRSQGRVSDGMEWLFGDEDPLGEDAFTFDTTASELLEDNLNSLSETVNETSKQIEGEFDPEGFTGGVGSSATEMFSRPAVADGGGRRARDGLPSGVVQQARDRFGLHIFDETLMAPDLSPAHFVEGAGMGPIFDVTSEELGDFMTPRAMRRSLDVEGILDNIHFLDSPHQLTGATFPDLLRHIDGGIDADTFFDRFIDMRRLRWEQLKEAFFDIRIGMTQFYDFLAALMPLVFVLIGSMPAVIGALTGLGAAAVGAAGGLAAIAGLGLMGAAAQEAGGDRPGFEDIAEVLSDIPDEFFEAFRGVADRLAPEFENALGGLSTLFDELAWRIDRVLTDTDILQMAQAFGQWLIPFIANTTDSLLRLADAARPVFSMIADGLGDRDILAGLAFSLSNVLPQLMTLTGMLIDALPTISRFSAGMANMLTNIVATAQTLGGLAVTFAEWVPFVDDGARALGFLTATFFTFMSATFLATKIAAIFRADLMRLLIAQIASTKWSTANAVAKLKEAAAIAKVGIASQAAALGITSLAGAVKALLATAVVGALLVGVGYAIMQLTDHFFDLENQVNDATDALQEFDRQQRDMADHGDGVYTGSLDSTVYVDVTDTTDIDINGGGGTTSDVEYASFIDNSRMDQIFS